MTRLDDHYRRLREQLESQGQARVFAFWADLDDSQRSQLLDDLDQIDLGLCERLIQSHVLHRPAFDRPASVEPATIYPAEPDGRLAPLYHQARNIGRDAIRAGKVGAFTVAGGQGTRLGFDGPKGAFEISPVRSAPLFQLFAEFLLGVRRRYGRSPPWYLMTSPTNHADTLAFFERHGFFGLDRGDVMFFAQRQMPAFTPDGRIALSQRHRIALSPDGHGGSLSALSAGGALDDMRRRGVELISYFQVDNPLVNPLDPLFLGLHVSQDSEMSSKAVTKAADTERVGNFCLADGKLTVIEYSDLPEELARARNADGTRRFDAGSIAIHVLNRSFVERLTARGAAVQLPWHHAEKTMRIVDPDGDSHVPTDAAVVKLEMFVFDAIPLARNPLVLYTPRAEEFSPVKNADGVDSAASARRDLVLRAARWLESCGVAVPRDVNGRPLQPLEISPQFALDGDDLRERLPSPPVLPSDQPFLLV